MYSEDVYLMESILGSIASIFSVSWSAVLLVCSIISGIITFLVVAYQVLLEGYPVFKMSKRLGLSMAWLAWLPVPVLGSIARTYLLCCMNNAPINLFKKWTIHNRNTAFLIYLTINLFGTPVISMVSIILYFIPGLGAIAGPLTTILAFVPGIACAYLKYIFMRDALNLFRDDTEANHSAAMISTIIDYFLKVCIVRPICLFLFYRKELRDDSTPMTVTSFTAPKQPQQPAQPQVHQYQYVPTQPQPAPAQPQQYTQPQ